MKKLLFVMPKFGLGGAEKSLLMFLRLLETYQDDYKVDLLLFKREGMFLKQLPSNVNLIECPSSLMISYSKFNLKNIKKPRDFICAITRIVGTAVCSIFANNMDLRNQYRWKYFYSKSIENLQEEYDIAFAYLDGEPVYYVVDKVKAKKIIGFNQNDYSKMGYNTKYDKKYFKKLTCIITLSEECKKIFIESFPECKNKVLIIPPIVSQRYIKECSKQFIPNEYKNITNIFVSVGRLEEQKGFDLAIAAADTLLKRNVDFVWFIIGNGSLYSQLESSIKKNHLENNIVLLGETENPYPYINGASIFIQPSRYEGKSVILNEAKMLGRPILVTNYSTVKDQIKNDCEGIIVDMDSKSIADGITKLLNNKDLCNKIVNYLLNELYEDTEIQKMYVLLLK